MSSKLTRLKYGAALCFQMETSESVIYFRYGMCRHLSEKGGGFLSYIY